MGIIDKLVAEKQVKVAAKEEKQPDVVPPTIDAVLGKLGVAEEKKVDAFDVAITKLATLNTNLPEKRTILNKLAAAVKPEPEPKTLIEKLASKKEPVKQENKSESDRLIDKLAACSSKSKKPVKKGQTDPTAKMATAKSGGSIFRIAK